MKSFRIVENEIFSKLKMFSDQSCVNRTETVDGTLRVLFYSHLSYVICVNIFSMNR